MHGQQKKKMGRLENDLDIAIWKTIKI